MSESCFPQVGQVAILNSMLELSGGVSTLTLRLFSNDRTPARTDVLADYNEVIGGGYASSALTNSEFTVTTGTPSQALYSDFVDFTFTGDPVPNTVYGAYITDANNVLISAERFDDAPFLAASGSLVRYKPRLLVGSINPV